MRDTYWHFGDAGALLSVAGAPSPGARNARPVLPLGVRALFARLSVGGAAPEPQGPDGARAAPDAATPCSFDRSLRATAQAAYRSVDGPADRALDVALAVMEAEIARLRSVVEEYGEALKTIEVYGADADARRVAANARRAVPCALRAPAPIPKFGQRRDG